MWSCGQSILMDMKLKLDLFSLLGTRINLIKTSFLFSSLAV